LAAAQVTLPTVVQEPLQVFLLQPVAAAYVYNISKNTIKGITTATIGTVATGVNGIYLVNTSATGANVNYNNISTITSFGYGDVICRYIHQPFLPAILLRVTVFLAITMSGTTGSTFNGIQLAGRYLPPI